MYWPTYDTTNCTVYLSEHILKVQGSLFPARGVNAPVVDVNIELRIPQFYVIEHKIPLPW